MLSKDSYFRFLLQHSFPKPVYGSDMVKIKRKKKTFTPDIPDLGCTGSALTHSHIRTPFDAPGKQAF